MCLILDLIRMFSLKDAPRRPKVEKKDEGLMQLCWVFNYKSQKHPDIAFTSDTVDEKIILQALEYPISYIKNRYDCSDFRVTWLIKLFIDGGQVLFNKSKENKIYTTIKDCLTSFKYWISDEGDDSICYYSENHQSTFATIEYLTGQLFENDVFADGLTGLQHKQRAKNRLDLWFNQRFNYGFSEFLSHNYLPVNICSLSLLLRYGDNEALKEKIKKVFDILFYDYALQLYKGTFVGPQGRAYPRNNMNCAYSEPNTDQIIDYVWQKGKFDYKKQIGQQVFFFTTMQIHGEQIGKPYYTVPQQIINIGNYDQQSIVKVSSGLTFEEMKQNQLIGTDINAEMFQLGMGALTNSEVIENTMSIIKRNKLWKNNFVSSFKYLNIWFLKAFHLLPKISQKYNFFTNGMALERINVYTYKNSDYKLSTLCGYKPGSSGAQQTTMALTLDDGVTVYTHHPLRDDKVIHAPSYWAGYGVAPHAAQDSNVTMLIHKIPKKVLLAPVKRMLSYTHTFLPEELLDEVIVDGNYAFAKKNNAVFALIAKNKFEYKPYDDKINEIIEGKLQKKMRYDLIQTGTNQFTIYEVSTLEKEGDFNTFIDRIKNNKYEFENEKLIYQSNQQKYALEYNGEFSINDKIVDLQFKRYQSQFGQTGRKDDIIIIKDYQILLEAKK